MRNLVGSIIKANNAFNLIKDGDKICVGVSGGKDSTLLFMALTRFAEYMKRKHRWNVSVVGCHVVMNYYPNVDYSKYKKFIKSNKLDLTFVDSNVGEVLKAKVNKKGKIQCSLCAKLKKAILVTEAKKMKCNKIAMGHHMDDAIETLFMNMINEGRISTFQAETFFDRSDIHMIRPFVLCREKEIVKEMKKQKIPVIKNMCPIEEDTHRTFIKNFLEKSFYENKSFRDCYQNFSIAMVNGKQSTLLFDDLTCSKKDLLKKINER